MIGKGKRYFVLLVLLSVSVICFSQKKEIKIKNYGSEIPSIQTYNINYLDTVIDIGVFNGFYFEQNIEYPSSYIKYFHNEVLNTANFTTSVNTIYYSDGTVEEPATKGANINSSKWIDSLRLDIEHPYYININNYRLSGKEERLSFENGSIKVDKLLHNYVRFIIKGEFEFWDRIVDIRAIGANGSYLVKDEEQSEFVDDKTEILERSYKGNIKEFEILIAEDQATQRLSIIAPNNKDVEFVYEATKIDNKDAIINPHTGDVIYRDSPYPLSRIGNYFYSIDEGGTLYLAILDDTNKKLFKLPSYLASGVEVMKERYLLTRERSTNRWGMVDRKGKVVIPFIYKDTDMKKLLEEIKRLQ